MALPFSFSSELKWSSHRALMHGPFENGTNLYAVLIDDTADTLEVWKSTDSGDSWSEQDSGNHKTVVASQACCHTVQSGTTLYIAYLIASDVVNIVPFSMATDTYGTVITGGPTAAVAGTASALSPPILSRRSDGDYVVLHNGPTQSIMGTGYRRVLYSRHEGSTWTLDTDVAGIDVQIHYDTRAAILGSSDRVHFFWTDATNSDLKHRSLTSANSLNTIQDVDTSVTIGNYTAGIPTLNGSEVVLPYKHSTGDLNVARATSADDPSWSTQTVTPADPESTDANPGAAAVDGSVVYVFWPDAATDDIFRDSDGGTGTWGVDVEWKDAVTCQGINIAKITNAIGVLYNDGGTVKYDVYTLTVPVIPPGLGPDINMSADMQAIAQTIGW